jgi:hypothetical protein
MNKDDKVTVKNSLISGVITDTEFDKSHMQLRHLVTFKHHDGEDHSRWFLESELVSVAAPAKPAK